MSQLFRRFSSAHLRRIALVTIVLGLSAGALAAPAAAQTPHWKLLRPGGRAPQPLQWAAAGYDEAENRMLIFGGTDQEVDYNDVWELKLDKDGELWDLLRPRGQAPVHRKQSAAAFDPVGDRLVIFGGHGRDRDRYYDETWLLDFSQSTGEWSKLPRDSDAPAGREGASLVYQNRSDALNPVRRMILFGGYNGSGAFNDVWAFDLRAGNESWSRIVPTGRAPVARDSHVAVYDSVSDRMIVFGGWESHRTVVTLGDVWSLSLEPGKEQWTEMTPYGRSPFPMAWGSAVFDACPGRERMLMFGGYTGQRSSSDTWSLSLSKPGTETWNLLDTTGAKPRPRDSNAIAFEPGAQRLVIYGGWDGPGNLMRDTWALELPECGIPTVTASATLDDPPTPTSTQDVPGTPTHTPTNTARIPTVSPTVTGPAATTPAPCADAFEPDDEWYQAKVLRMGAGPQLRSIHRPGDVDYAKIVAEQGRTYTVRTLGLAAGLDTRLHLYDIDGVTVIDWNDDDPSNPPASRLDWTCDTGGSYFVKVDHLDPGTGDCDLTYQLELNVQSQATWTPTTGTGPIFLPLVANGTLAPEVTPTPDTTICDPGFERGRFGDLRPPLFVDNGAVEPRLGAVSLEGVRIGPDETLHGFPSQGAASVTVIGPAGAVSPLSRVEAERLDPSFRLIHDRLLRLASSVPASGLAPTSSGHARIAYALPLQMVSPNTVIPHRVSGDTKIRMLISTSDRGSLTRLGVSVRAHTGDVVAAVARAELLDDIARLPSVVKVEPPSILEPSNDLGRADAKVPEAATTYGVTGKGVTVAVIDTGIDFTHPSFIDSGGNTRIKALLDLAYPGDQDADGVLDGPGPAGGTLYTEAQINSAVRDELAGQARFHRWIGEPLAILNDTTVQSRLTVPVSESLTISSIALQLSMVHHQLDDLEIKLQTPDGAQRMLPAFARNSPVNHFQASFDLSGLGGATTAGTWTLEIRDRTAGDQNGELRSWGLHVNRLVRQSDLDGHGTHVTGSAAGDDAPSGTTVLGQYAGVAPGADIIFVRDSRSLDAGDHRFAHDDIVAGMQWVDSFARSLGQPYVTNMSLGAIGGPLDGTGVEDRGIDALVGSGKKGRAIVVANGNDGDVNWHSGGDFDPTIDAIDFVIPEGAPMERLEVWFEGPMTATVGLTYPATSSLSCFTSDLEFVDHKEDCDAMELSPGDPTRLAIIYSGDDIINYGYITWGARDPFNGDFGLQLALLGFAENELLVGPWQLKLAGATGRWDAWSHENEVLVGADNRMTVASPSSAKNAISVGAHVTRNSWTSSSGGEIGTGLARGNIADFSSRGPTRDGRTKPDIAAPGAYIVSALSHDANYFQNLVISDLHVALPGTSMAAPHVAGAVALLMSHPDGADLDSTRIRQILQGGARRDGWTRPSPEPNTWGAGKLDVEGAFRNWDPSSDTTVTPRTPTATPRTPTATSSPSATGEAPTTTVAPPLPTLASPTTTQSVPTDTVAPPVPTLASPTTTLAVPTIKPTPPETGTPSVATATATAQTGGCWNHGGELPQSVVTTLDDGTGVHGGRYSALLGDPSLGPALPGSGNLPVGSAWVEQTVRVPDTASARLSYWYRMITYDVAQDTLRQVWDIFAVYVDGELVFSDGNKAAGSPGSRHEIGWRLEELDMTRWRGQTVTIRFASWNGHDRAAGAESYNTWTYLDDVYLVP